MMRRFLLLSIISAWAVTSADAALTPSLQNLPPLQYSSVAWAPLDTAGTESGMSIIALSGLTRAEEFKTYIIWVEPGFTDQPSVVRIDSVSVPGVIFGDLDWADYDRDGYLDLAIAGRYEGIEDTVGHNMTRIYRQVWNGGTYQNFTLANGPNWDSYPIDSCTVQWVDFDVDGYVDLYVSGRRRIPSTDKVTGATSVRGATDAFMFKNNLVGPNHEFEVVTTNSSGLNQVKSVYRGGFDWGDMDGDGDPDLVVTGTNLIDFQGNRTIRSTVSEIYVNDPRGVLTLEEDQHFDGVYDGGVAWGDYDADGKPDLAITGRTEEDDLQVLRVYQNVSGSNLASFTLTSISLDNALSVAGGIEWVDFSGDGLADLVSMGTASSGLYTSGLRYFENNGDGTFSRNAAEDGSFPEMIDGDFVIGHLDGNGTAEIITTGYNVDASASESVAWLSDHAAPAEDLLPPSINRPRLRFTDTQIVFVWDENENVDESVTYDVLMYYTNPSNPSVKPFKIFSGRAAYQRGLHGIGPLFAIDRPLAPNPSMQLFIRSVDAARRTSAWSDKILVQVQDFLLSEENISPLQVGLATWADLDNNGWPDLILNGLTNNLEFSNLAYLNEGGDLQARDQFNLGGLSLGGVFWGDVDGDGYLDAFMTGSLDAQARVTAVYRNLSGDEDGVDGTFSARYSDEELPSLTGSRIAVGDLDNDGDVDAIAMGLSNAAATTFLLVNKGLVYSDTETPKVNIDTVAFDLQLADIDPVNVKAADGLLDGWVTLHDIDQDGDLDITMQGNVDYGLDDPQGGSGNNFVAGYTTIYRNLGSLQFEKWHGWSGDTGLAGIDTIPPGSDILDQLSLGQHQWVDVDNDGDPDLVIAGYSSVSTDWTVYSWDYDASTLRIYENTGGGNLVMKQGLQGLYRASMKVADLDNDQYPDIVLSGFNDHDPNPLLDEGMPTTWYLRNKADGTFERQSIELFETIGADSNDGVAEGGMSMADYDQDGDLDIIITGRYATSDDPQDKTFAPASRLYSNTTANSGLSVNSAPNAPGGLTADVDTTSTVELSWIGSTETNAGVTVPYTYALRIGSSSGANDIRSGAEPYGQGRLGYVTSARVDSLADGAYSWSVRAVDPGLRRSNWASEQQFIIDTSAPIVAGVLGDSIGIGSDGDVRLNINFDDALTGVDTSNTAMAITVSLAGDTQPRTVEKIGWNPGDVWVGSVKLLPLSTFLSEPVTFRISGVKDLRGNVAPDTTFTETVEFNGTTITARSGGTVTSVTEAVKLYVPPNAVSGDVGVSLIERTMVGLPDAPSNATPAGIVAQLAPDVNFLQPAVLTMYYGGTEGAARIAQSGSLHIFRLNDAEDGWVYIGGRDNTETEEVIVPVMQLGTYALFDAPGATSVETLADLTCVPRVFSPGVDLTEYADASSDKTSVTFSVAAADAGNLASVKVFNRAGRLVRKISGEGVVSGANSIDWDGRDQDLDYVPSGIYIVKVEVGGAEKTQTVVVLNKYPRP